MEGRRYSEGLHQAIEAKERVTVAKENKTLATITFQNYFRLYDKLAGMTGTALTEEEEFGAIYGLDIVEIPTNRPLARIDNPDVVYKNETGKNRAIIEQIVACHEKGQPVLVGTVSIEKSEYLSSLLKRRGVKHNVLNAKQHEKEAEIVAQAGKFGAVTISTNMAGRGTDIMLGGNAEFLAKNDLKKAGFDDEIIAEATGFADTDNEDVLNARKLFAESMEKHRAMTSAEAERVRSVGGLFILGTERHESRRIDNQLRGRAGRQGDPGETRFYLALTDDIMRLFGSERVMNMMETLGVDEDTPIDQKMLSNAIEQSQKRVESRNFQSRKTVLEFDDVMNKQREIIYSQRARVLNGDSIADNVQAMLSEVIRNTVVDGFAGNEYPESASDLKNTLDPFTKLFLTADDINFTDGEACSMSQDDVIAFCEEKAHAVYAAREEAFGTFPETGDSVMRELERVVMLRVVDELWMDHIDAMHDLRQSASLRAYGQVKPIDAYKKDGFDMFEGMVNGIREEVVRRVFTVRVRTENDLQRKSVSSSANATTAGDGTVKRQPVKAGKKVGRNDPCPCGSGKKYKKCCGANE